jgi:antitoxin component of MazEF toxin-antitoxin module
MNSLAKTRRLGGSIIVTIPKELVDAEDIAPDQLVQITVSKARRSGFGIAKRLTPMTKDDKLRGQLE